MILVLKFYFFTIIHYHTRSLGKCHFLPGGGAPENWGGSGTLSKIKRGIKGFFQIKKGDHLYFLKK